MRIASRPSVCLAVFVCVLASVCVVSPAGAQPADVIGVRAQGMGGAFTAVADDASASWWNPAGLAGGAYLNTIIEFGQHDDPPHDQTPAGAAVPAWRAEVRSFGIAFPALGLSYYRLRFSEIQPQTSTGATGADRQEVGAVQVRLRSIALNQFGATMGQSIGSHLVVGSTLKLVNAGVATGVATGNVSLDTAAGIEVPSETHGDVDLGFMAMFGKARIGLTVRNLWQPDFNTGLDAFNLQRQARLGVAMSSGGRGAIGTATLAFDADLTATPTVLGDERRLALGAEMWMPTKTFGFRGGVSGSTLGLRRTALSAGGSVAMKKGVYLDGEYTGGTDLGRRGWSVSFRVTYP